MIAERDAGGISVTARPARLQRRAANGVRAVVGGDSLRAASQQDPAAPMRTHLSVADVFERSPQPNTPATDAGTLGRSGGF